jgi:hypothetical protein
MCFGELELFSLSDGFFGLDGGAMWAQAPAGASGVVPRPLWEQTNPQEEPGGFRVSIGGDGLHSLSGRRAGLSPRR